MTANFVVLMYHLRSEFKIQKNTTLALKIITLNTSTGEFFPKTADTERHRQIDRERERERERERSNSECSMTDESIGPPPCTSLCVYVRVHTAQCHLGGNE